MRVLIDGNVHDPLSPAEEQDVRQFRAEESVQGSVLSADEATKARVSQTKRVLAIFWGLIAVAAAGIASLAEPPDLPVVLTVARMTGTWIGKSSSGRSTSRARVLFPEPLTPVRQTKRFSGISTERFFRLWRVAF